MDSPIPAPPTSSGAQTTGAGHGAPAGGADSGASARRVPKSEHEPARTEVDEVAPGVLRLQLPIDFTGLAHINTYALVDGEGVAIVDPGLPGRASWVQLHDRLRKAGIPAKRIHSILVTHSHPDHFGNAGRLAHESGADVVTHRAFRTLWTRPHVCELDDCDDARHAHGEPGTGPLPPGFADVMGRQLPWSTETFHPGGGGRRQSVAERLLRQRRMSALARLLLKPPVPTRRVRSNEPLRMAGREWFALHTPGHTVDHLCLYDPEGGVFISGDHVLPGITPHVGGIGNGPDPMRRFFASLRLAGALEGVHTVLPAHGKVFHDLRGRTEEILDHHAERLQRLREALAADGPSTVEAMSHHLFRKERWGHMAQSETFTHLEYLLSEGDVTRIEHDGTLTYALRR